MFIYPLLLSFIYIQATSLLTVKVNHSNRRKRFRWLLDNDIEHNIIKKESPLDNTHIQSDNNAEFHNNSYDTPYDPEKRFEKTHNRDIKALIYQNTGDLNALIEGLKAENPTAKIIVVNSQPDKNVSKRAQNMEEGERTESDKDPESIDNFDDYELQHIKNSNLYQKDEPITISDIDTLEELLEIISGVYDAYYAVLPNRAPEERSALEKTSDVLNLYAKIRSFVAMVKNDRKQVLEDLKLLEKRIKSLEISEEDMLKFYGLDIHYDQATKKSKKFEGKDMQFREFFDEIFNTTPRFETTVKEIVSKFSLLIKASNSFRKEVEKLKVQSEDDNLLQLLSKLDSVMNLIYTLLRLKSDIVEAIKTLRTAFKDIKAYREEISHAISEINKLAEYHRLIALGKEKKGSAISSIYVVISLSIVTFY